ncbi:MAG TPA: hypothetical protein VIU37_01630 [Candidatus Limnocylindrales bacterium]|jgi:hypothetical protein
MTAYLSRVRKALAAGVAALVVPLAAGFVSESESGTHLTESELVTAIVTGVLAFLATWAVKPNAEPPA